MWTLENRDRYDRSRLCYPSDLTDAEWALIEPSIPPAKRGGNKRTVDVREVINGVMYILSAGCQWAKPAKVPSAKPMECRRRELCPRTSHRAARSTTTSGAGATTARWIAFIIISTCNVVTQPDERPVRLQRLSTARASRQQKKGVLDRPCGI